MKCECQCKHESVKYCDKCHKVHCELCGMTWDMQSTVTYAYPNYNIPQVPWNTPDTTRPYYGDQGWKITCSDNLEKV
jgi:hypothetical protein